MSSYEIRLESWGNAVRKVTARGKTKDGLVIGNIELATTADRAKNTVTRELPGEPTELQISTADGVRRGECYARAFLLLGGVVVRQLCAGYTYDGNVLVLERFEGFTDGPGLIRAITGTNPAAGVEISEAVPTNARWRLISFAATIVCDATVATRIPKLLIRDATPTTLQGYSPGGGDTVAAGETQPYQWMSGLGMEHTDRPDLGAVQCMIPNLIMFQGWIMTTSTTAIVAGDNWGAPVYVVEEWIEE